MTPRRPISILAMSAVLVCGIGFSVSRATHDTDRTATEITEQILDTQQELRATADEPTPADVQAQLDQD